ncbi:D-alanyl-D-alanine carboxypeptidase family protein [Alicyclobacillus tolerans]|uniref:D-alanyl-D-alanine carboxypeptidase (Penicillin-binding protein 5/6) n=1 Tax=Alicyclobacillus tolerans TaxID=90970 RepID=A0A1M6N3I2_9BACL|nr:serine hydrolase [Alicyclobacillus montanus]SHJ90143.1 D-alanyl-D-alanine carboxypeptidase (penicillin-binding protein 5/6) [Alicyclobacillus montanus]
MRIRWIVLLIVLLVIALPVVQLLRPIPSITATPILASDAQVPGQASIRWPQQGEAALEVLGIGEMGHFGSNTPLPIASVTKLMTAYLTLKKYPLGVGESGPELTMTPKDVQVYQEDVAQGESVMKVVAGEKLSERQLLEGLLLPSGNNVAYILAHWVAGSQSAFVQQMNAEAKKLGMTHTHYVDASGFNPGSASDAQDLLKLFNKVIQIRAFRDISGMAQATVPVAGTIYNVDYNLGQGGIFAGKTGSTPQAGGCFVFASKKMVDGKKATILGVVLGQEGLQPLMNALNEGVSLSEQAQKMIRVVQVLPAQTPVAQLSVPWMSNPITVTTTSPISMVGWPGMTVHRVVHLDSMKAHSIAAGQTIGTVTVIAGNQKISETLTAPTSIPAPSYSWRLKHI